MSTPHLNPTAIPGSSTDMSDQETVRHLSYFIRLSSFLFTIKVRKFVSKPRVSERFGL